jgi:uncharacterized membrane protein
MSEPQDIAPDLPEEEETPYDEPPAPAADPPLEGDEEPVGPPVAPPAEPPIEPRDEAAVAEADHADLFETEPVEVVEDPGVDPVEVEAGALAPEAPLDPHDFGPEPWDQPPADGWASIGPAPADPEPVAVAAAPAAHRGAETSYEVKRAAYAVYLLYLSGLVVPVLPLIVGVLLASNRVKDAPDWLESHYTFQIRTFWIGLAGLGLAGVLLFLPFGLFPLTIVATAVWLVTRCFVGMVRLHRGEPIFDPQTWTV